MKDLVRFGVFAFLILVPALLLVWVRFGTEGRLDEIEIRPEPIVLDAVPSVDDQLQPALARLTWAPGDQVRSPGMSGIVTWVGVAEGDSIVTGDTIARVDSVARLAVSSGSPLFRPLGRGDGGPDVETLQEILVALGYLVDAVDGRYGSGTEKAVQELSADLGLERATSVFDPAWFIWLPTEPFAVEEVLVDEGQAAPAVGEVMLQGPPKLAAVQVWAVGDDGEQLVDGEWAFHLAGRRIAVDDGIVPESELTYLASSFSADISEASVQIFRPHALSGFVIPASAVLNTDDQLFVCLEETTGFVRRDVAIADGSVARVFVTDGLEVGDRVLANPAEILQGRREHCR